jgi:dTDP-glucose 4,6-dehydratase
MRVLATGDVGFTGCAAVRAVVARWRVGQVGEVCDMGGSTEARNIDVSCVVAAALDAEQPEGAHHGLLAFVADRPGRAFRYATDASKIAAELGWRPSASRENGLRRTVAWRLADKDRLRAPLEGVGRRLGLGG